MDYTGSDFNEIVPKGNDAMNKIFALFSPDGVMHKCSDSFASVTNHMPLNTYSTEMWNSLFGADPLLRKQIYEQNGWAVKEGKFVETQRLILKPNDQ